MEKRKNNLQRHFEKYNDLFQIDTMNKEVNDLSLESFGLKFNELKFTQQCEIISKILTKHYKDKDLFENEDENDVLFP